jgi:pterin-4a-carbinolamine dehydratase
MEPGSDKLAFISYRREDSSAYARSLRDNLESAFGTESVFMDVEEVRIGTQWPKVIEAALAKASILLVVIGPDWLLVHDTYGRRRLDKPGDWVHDEIVASLLRSIPIISVFVSQAPKLQVEALPEDLASFGSFQHFALRDEHWRKDTDILLARVEQLGFKRIGQRYTFPIRGPKARIPRSLSDAEVAAQLQDLDGWEVVSSPLPGEHPKRRVEIMKAFQFKRFEDAVAFMFSAAPIINKLNHHPRWENVWKTLTIWSSTWDAGHVITYLDIELAKLIENLYRDFPGKAQNAASK